MRIVNIPLSLAAIFAMGGSTLYAAETLTDSDSVSVEDDHAYETVVHVDDKKEGFALADGWKITATRRHILILQQAR